MEELVQEPETIIQQLRLLLAAREEELAKLRRGAGGGDEEGDSVADHLIEELDEKKKEVEELTTAMEQLRARANEKLSSMAEGIEERDRVIASLREGSAGEPAGDNTDVTARVGAALEAEREKMAKRLAELGEQLREKERRIEEMERRLEEGYSLADGEGDTSGRDEIIASLRSALERDREKMAKRLAELAGQLEEKERKLEDIEKELEEADGRADRGGTGEDEVRGLRDQLDQARAAISGLEAAAADEERAQAEVEQLRGQLESVTRDAESRVAGLESEIERLTAERDEALDAAAGTVPSAKGEEREELLAELEKERDKAAMAIQELAETKSQVSSLREDLRRVGEEYQHSELSYRTAQSWLHKLGIANGLLKAACVGLGVFLIFALATRRGRGGAPGPVVESVPYGTVMLAEGKVQAPAAPEGTSEKAEKREDERAPSQKLDEEIIKLAGAKKEVVKPESEERSGDQIAYTVKKGDNLWSICMRELGDPKAMNRIARDNNLNNPHALQVGDVIYLSRR